MKKLIALCLAMLLCLSVFAACDTGRIIEETTAGKEETTVAGGEETTVAGGEETTVAGGEETTVGGSEDTTAGGSEETTTSGSAYDVEAAKENVKALNNNLLKNPVTGKDFTVTPQVMIAGVAYTVTWTVNTDEVTIDVNAEDNTVTVNINEDALEDLAYVLTATVTAPDGTTAALEFNLTVPKFKFTTFAEYAAAENKAFVTVTGIVTGVFSKATGSQANGLYIQDLNNEGGYYVYNLTDDPNGVILPGMTVVVRGDKDLYNGTYEIINASVQVVDETIKTVEPIDYTEILAGAEKLNDAALVTKQALLVTVKGVTILEVGDNGYYYFQLGEHKVYLRISSSNNATTSEAIANIKAIHAANYGNVADVTGVISIYSGNFYLSPVSADAFSNISVPERTDAEKVALELGGLNLDASASSDKVIDLPVAGTTYDNVTFTWTTADTTGAAVVTDNKLTLTIPDEELVVTITVTAKCGDAEDTKSFEIKLSKTITTIADAIAIGSAKDHNTYTEEKYLVAGIIKEVYNTTYGNMYIVDELGNEFTVYGSYIEGTKYGEFEGAKPVAGDYVVLLGSLGQYSGTTQMKNADIMSFTTPITIPEANELGNTFEKNQYTEDKKVITGEITEVQNTTYGNVVIKDAEGNSILVYGLYSSNGATRYDAMATKPAVGDTITVLGVIGKYNAPQMKNGWLIAHTVASGEEGTDTPPAVEPEDKMTAEEILNALYGLADGEALTGSFTLTGKITEIDNWNNPTIVVEGFEDKPVYCYKLVVSNAVGDVITVTATDMKNYGGKYEFMNCTLVTEDNGGDNTEDTTTPDAGENTPEGAKTYTFANYEAGEQYAAGEVHKLDDNVTVTTTDCHFTTQLRLYYSAVNDYNPNGRNGVAVFAMTSAVKSLSLNAGGKAGPIEVYGSTDGETWTLITTIESTSTYTDYDVALGETPYTYIKLAATASQVRVASITIELQ